MRRFISRSVHPTSVLGPRPWQGLSDGPVTAAARAVFCVVPIWPLQGNVKNETELTAVTGAARLTQTAGFTI